MKDKKYRCAFTILIDGDYGELASIFLIFFMKYIDSGNLAHSVKF